jgi:hypothetical protein
MEFFNTISGKRTFKRGLFESQATGFAMDTMAGARIGTRRLLAVLVARRKPGEAE